MTKVLVPLMEGFEEIEAVTIIDVLRRAGLEVVVAGNATGSVAGAHGIGVNAEVALASVNADDYEMIVLPGGLPGAQHLADSPVVQSLVQELRERNRYTCAICAAPMALAAAGVHAGKTMTCYPGFEDKLSGATHVTDRVVVDGKMVTSRGPGTALDFALTLAGLLTGAENEATLRSQMLADKSTAARIV